MIASTQFAGAVAGLVDIDRYDRDSGNGMDDDSYDWWMTFDGGAEATFRRMGQPRGPGNNLSSASLYQVARLLGTSPLPITAWSVDVAASSRRNHQAIISQKRHDVALSAQAVRAW